MPLRQLTPPTALPLEAGLLRLHLRQDEQGEDGLIALYMAAAVEFAEAQTGRQLLAARYRYIMDSFPGPSLMGVPYGVPFGTPPHAIQLPRSPLIQVEGIHYLDMSGTEHTVDPSLYTIDAAFEPARITPRFGQIWPVPLPQIGSVWVDFSAGYCAPVTVNATADTLTVDGWPALTVGAQVRLSNSGGNLPAPLLPRRDYFIAEVAGESIYRLAATSGGEPIDLASAGTGLHFLGQPGGAHAGSIPDGLINWLLLRIESAYSHRGEVTTVRGGSLEPLPFADRLLDPYRVIAI